MIRGPSSFELHPLKSFALRFGLRPREGPPNFGPAEREASGSHSAACWAAAQANT